MLTTWPVCCCCCCCCCCPSLVVPKSPSPPPRIRSAPNMFDFKTALLVGTRRINLFFVAEREVFTIIIFGASGTIPPATCSGVSLGGSTCCGVFTFSIISSVTIIFFILGSIQGRRTESNPGKSYLDTGSIPVNFVNFSITSADSFGICSAPQ